MFGLCEELNRVGGHAVDRLVRYEFVLALIQNVNLFIYKSGLVVKLK